jgi:hypothetical protein
MTVKNRNASNYEPNRRQEFAVPAPSSHHRNGILYKFRSAASIRGDGHVAAPQSIIATIQQIVVAATGF